VLEATYFGVDHTINRAEQPRGHLAHAIDPFVFTGTVCWSGVAASLSGKWFSGRVQLLAHK
jgi:hypothetical protein